MSTLVSNYYLNDAYDELIGSGGRPRPATRPLFDFLATIDAETLDARRQAVEAAIVAMGITFTVYSEAGNIDRAWPFDIIPRILSAEVWKKVAAGCVQRVKALNMFLHDVDAARIEHMLNEILEQIAREDQAINLEAVRTHIAASIACHAAIKVNMPLEQNKMEWLLTELAKTEHPMTCPHGRPVVLRYSMQDIQKAFKRI